MGQDKEKDTLKVEDLEQRVAPMLVYTEPEPDPTGGGGATIPDDGTGIGDPDQPGNSDDRRNKPWKGDNV